MQFHPNPNRPKWSWSTDRQRHKWTLNTTTNTWTAPPGVHLFLQQLVSCGPQTAEARAWSMTRPDRTKYFYDCEASDRPGRRQRNEADFTYSERQSENKPEEFLAYITDRWRARR